MIEERIVISDANVIFDLLSVQLLEVFFALPCEICTTDLVISEIERPEQQKAVDGGILIDILYDRQELFLGHIFR